MEVMRAQCTVYSAQCTELYSGIFISPQKQNGLYSNSNYINLTTALCHVKKQNSAGVHVLLTDMR